jgi:hypothetical protein
MEESISAAARARLNALPVYLRPRTAATGLWIAEGIKA